MKKLAMVASLVFAAMLVMPLQAQNLDGVRLFQSYFFDAPIAGTGYGEGGLIFAKSSYSTPFGSYSTSTFSPGVQGGYPINDKIELQASLYYISVSPEKGDNQSGISDLGIYGRYNVYNQKQTNISAGGMVTLPIGSEDVGQSKLNFGAFGAVRHSLNNGFVLAGTLGLIFYETEEINFNTGKSESKHDSYLNIGFGGIYPLNQQLNLVGELNIHSEGKYMLLSGGADYQLGNGRLRGLLGIGLDDGAPDFTLTGSYQMSF